MVFIPAIYGDLGDGLLLLHIVYYYYYYGWDSNPSQMVGFWLGCMMGNDPPSFKLVYSL